MDVEEIKKMASECLNCKNPLCRNGCPISTNIPGFIEKIKQDNFEEAYYILQQNNIMSEICSNVCFFEECCEGKCIKGIKGNSVKVASLEKQINLWANRNGIEYKECLAESNNIKIAVIGSGPAGISCAVELARKGFSVTIFEKEEKVGGLLTYGIPGFRLPRDLPDKLNEKLKKLNIKIETKKELGKNFTIQELKNNNYKAIFLGLGMPIPSSYKLNSEISDDICDSTYFLKEYNAKRIVKNLEKVVIIGGGNVACDAARAAIKMGAKDVKILYRRNQEKMPARKIEVNHAIEEGTKIEFNTKVLSAELEKGRLKNLKCIKTICVNNEIKDLPESEFITETTKVVFAIGYKTDKTLIEKIGIKTDTSGMIIVDKNNMTNIEGIFAGGDVSQTRATVCNAILEGKNAAKGIEKYIKTEDV